MEALETQIATLDSTKAIPVPEQIFATLGLHEGSCVALSVQGGNLVVKPLDAIKDKLEKVRDKIAADSRLSDEFEQMRREERRLELDEWRE